MRYTSCGCDGDACNTVCPAGESSLNYSKSDHPEAGGKRDAGLESSRSRTFCLAIIYAVNAVYGAYLGAIGLLLPRIGVTFQLDSGRQGRIMSAGFAGSVVSVLVCGYLSDRIGRRSVLIVAGVWFAVGLLLVGASHAEWFVLCAAPLIGAGSAGTQTSANALAADLYPERRGVMLNACQIAFAAGAVVGPAVLGAALVSGLLWRVIYYALALVVTLLTVAALKVPVVSGDSVGDTSGSPGIYRLFVRPAFLALCAAQLFYAGAEVGFFEWMPTYFTHVLPGGAMWADRVVSLFWLAMTLGRLGMGVLLHRFRSLTLGVALAALGGVGASLALLSHRPAIVILFVMHTGLCFGGIYSAILVEASDRFPRSLGSAIGGIAAASSIGTSTVPWAIGALALAPGGWRVALMLVPASVWISGLLMLILGRRKTGKIGRRTFVSVG